MKNKLKNFSVIGIRTITDDENYNVGDICRNSYDWDFENDCSTYNTDNPVQLNGTCAIEIFVDCDIEDMTEEEIINEINNAECNYAGSKKILIGGNSSSYGDDENEVIIRDAEVIAILF